MRLILDTHTFLWLITIDPQLSATAHAGSSPWSGLGPTPEHA
jgi:hypothetical protein